MNSKLAYQIEIFTNRLKKQRKHLWKWAKKNGITCFRVYDRDIPEIPFAVDIYEDYLHIWEYERERLVKEPDPKTWTRTLVDAAGRALSIPDERVFFKTRVRQEEKNQYDKFSTKQVEHVVQEGGLRFKINLSDYLDTGLFLDHRLSRQYIRELAAGTRFLNLFSYTGSFTVYAASGGATKSVSVDLSNTYNEWARENLGLNGFDIPSHSIVRDDVFAFLASQKRSKERYDLIVLDPPTFSNSKKMNGVLDIQRDHAALIEDSLSILSPDGLLFFSTNFKKFRLNRHALKHAEPEDITEKTIPQDFRDRKIHYAWVIRRN